MRKHCLPLYLFTIMLTGCTNDSNCLQSLRHKCLDCHRAATTCAKLGASQQQWLQTIDAMIALKANISAQERTALASCLSRADSLDILQFCDSN
ncbi:MAG: hypothetical protein GX087_06620 [Desulfobulbaceae bacterium]|nr:hypothetical protein [Desulfobulbaceae bacterium]